MSIPESLFSLVICIVIIPFPDYPKGTEWHFNFWSVFTSCYSVNKISRHLRSPWLLREMHCKYMYLHLVQMTKIFNGMEIVTFYIHVYVLSPLHFKSWDVINDTFMKEIRLQALALAWKIRNNENWNDELLLSPS